MLYFAYGSNMNVESMMLRCPSARPMGPAVAPSFRLVFRQVADIVPAVDSCVYGTLWSITKRCEDALDRYEGLAVELYRKDSINVSDDAADLQSLRPALVYRMNSTIYFLPDRKYLEIVRAGYGDFGWSEALLTEALDYSLAQMDASARMIANSI